METTRAAAPGPNPRYSLLGSVRTGNALEETVERLLRGIKNGIFPPGERLPAERELAKILGVSRATLRDALAELQQAQYLSVLRGRYGGAVVAEELPSRGTAPGSEDRAAMEDVLAFRAAVEPAAAALAAEATLTASERTRLLDGLHSVATAEPGQYRPLDARLHVTIAELGASPRLAAAVAEARAATSDLLDSIPFLERNIEHSDRQHRGIVDAILAGDPCASRTLMLEHLEGTAALLRGFLIEEAAGDEE